MIDPTPIYSPFEIQDFDTWFHQNSYDEDLIEAFRLAWNAAVSACGERIGMHEGTDFGIEDELISKVGA